MLERRMKSHPNKANVSRFGAKPLLTCECRGNSFQAQIFFTILLFEMSCPAVAVMHVRCITVLASPVPNLKRV